MDIVGISNHSREITVTVMNHGRESWLLNHSLGSGCWMKVQNILQQRSLSLNTVKISQLEVLMSLNLNNKLYIMYQYLEVLMTTKYK